MSGLKGQSRVPNTRDPRQRRNSANLASEVSWISANEIISLNGDGELTLTLATNSGLANSSGALTIDLGTTPGLQLASDGISVVGADPVEVTPAGVGLTAEYQRRVNQAGNVMVPITTAAMTQVASEEAAEEAIVAAATLSWMGF